jgi:hypothetical protein
MSLVRPLKYRNDRFGLVALAPRIWLRHWRYLASPLAARERQVALASHRYKVGQSVRFSSNVLRRFGSNSSFKIVKLLPSEGDQQQYRIKSAGEAHERIAKESELNLDS